MHAMYIRCRGAELIRIQSLRVSTQSSANMSQSNLQMSYCAWAPDSKVGDAVEKRKALDSEHNEWFQARLADGSVLEFGGAILAKDEKLPLTGVPDIGGTLLIFKADSLEDARKLIEQEPYYKAGVWDTSDIKIAPILSRA
ncbi:uncharacterized protein B0H18DRAFT_1041437 [Fomitopsis serialis]|uniref:uncharacterized protein n=1 Tax=Fomitopsis serialis TaxID=139415 RepID=UPI002007AE01|nr:uncharacterized protein B0H18DRAFT_1041437 [Neoantrodia serialis]KAH9915489.1 hypothetical protein B0H18DRAFT_1041437 [Neoantrodia serialis]